MNYKEPKKKVQHTYVFSENNEKLFLNHHI